jgi:hypothetical protein
MVCETQHDILTELQAGVNERVEYGAGIWHTAQ